MSDDFNGCAFCHTQHDAFAITKTLITCGMQKLFRYISGNNVDNKKISMTTPVITFVKPSEDFKSAQKNYTVAFYLPAQFQVTPSALQRRNNNV